MSIYKTLSVILVSQKQKIMQIMHYYNYGRNIMTKLSNTFFLIVLFIFYCEQREVYYSDLANKEAPSSLVVFYERASTVTSCGVKCLNDNCCIRFIYNKMNKQCVGIHVLEKSGYSYQQVPPISPVAQQFVKGCGSDWVEFKGHCYSYGQQTVSWFDAKLRCQNMCSYLVEIDDREESDWLFKTFVEKGSCSTNLYTSNCSAWTGGNDLVNEGHYVMDHSNTSIVFTNWHTGEPSLHDPSQAPGRDCIDIIGNGKWNDRPCSHNNKFICEKII